MLGSMQV